MHMLSLILRSLVPGLKSVSLVATVSSGLFKSPGVV